MDTLVKLLIRKFERVDTLVKLSIRKFERVDKLVKLPIQKFERVDTLVKLPIQKFEWVDTLVKLPQKLSGMYIWVHHSAAAVEYPDWVLVVCWSSDDETLQPASSRPQIVARLRAPVRAEEVMEMSRYQVRECKFEILQAAYHFYQRDSTVEPASDTE